ncbi:unnamed protein product [Fraxinus pennsylvanica]|uniref:Uncharacterized protein n=1 Tax=Fraxinus pennsylvanica TaxID=56036 RepID=A0AAD1ZMP7_9LAMI|nr:unnamed protein product [Fraxinus pennsylvanica]
MAEQRGGTNENQAKEVEIGVGAAATAEVVTVGPSTGVGGSGVVYGGGGGGAGIGASGGIGVGILGAGAGAFIVRAGVDCGCWTEKIRHFYFYNTSGSKGQKARLIIFCFNIISVQCLEKISKYNFNDSDPPSQSEPPGFDNKFRRISLSILFGVIAGLIFAPLTAFLIRYLIRYINRSPILKGPVVFSPKTFPKTL